jgi:hypothetical protein
MVYYCVVKIKTIAVNALQHRGSIASQAQAHGHATRRASVQRHTRGEAPLIIHLISKKYLNAKVRSK